MNFKYVHGTGALVEPIDVLRDQREPWHKGLKLRKSVVSGIGFHVVNHMQSMGIPFANTLWICEKAVHAGKLLGTKLRPQSIGIAERCYTAFGANAGTGENDDVVGRPQSLNDCRGDHAFS